MKALRVGSGRVSVEYIAEPLADGEAVVRVYNLRYLQYGP